MKYIASYDLTTKMVTGGILLLFIGIILGQLVANDFRLDYSMTLVSVLFLLIIGGTYLFSITHYEVTDEALIIKRPISDIEIKRTNIENVKLLEKSELDWSIRTFGVGACFGYYGKFWNKKFGNMTWYTTKRGKSVLIELVGKKIIITPNNVEQMIEELETR